MPLVSVVMPVYNGERFLKSAVDSVLAQTFPDIELIIVDDGSTDGSYQIAMAYSDPRVRVRRHERNLGIVEALNGGIKESLGQYICRMDADDVAVAKRIELQVRYMEKNTYLAVVGANVILIDEDGAETGLMRYALASKEIKKTIFHHNPFAHGATMIRKSVLKTCGLYDRRFLHNEDYDLWLRIAAQYEVANLPDFLLKRRVHTRSITGSRETELTGFRIRALLHAILHYYKNPFLMVYLVRPLSAYLYRRTRDMITS